jgi:uncharacterized small protein (DUF1192 family)
MAEHLPDETLLIVHKGLLQHQDWRAREAGLDGAYKLKGLYKATKVAVTSDLDGLTVEELDERIAELQPILERSKMFGKTRQRHEKVGTADTLPV